MALKPEKRSSVPPLAEDVYCGVCYTVADLGQQYSEKYKKTSHRVMLIWEITGETVEIDGKPEPRVISKEYALAWGDRSELKKLSDALFGSSAHTEDTFEAKLALGKPCQLSVTIEKKEDGTERNRVSAITRLIKGMAAHEPKELIYYEIGDESTHGAFEKLPGWIQDKIKKSASFSGSSGGNAVVDIPDGKPAETGKAAIEESETIVPF